jgi:type IV pilus assembly protein PilY1
MKIIFTNILKFFFLYFLFTVNALAKSLPPGSSDNEIPTNILIMLDKSGSMDTCIGSGACSYNGAAPDGNGNIFVSDGRNAIYKFKYPTATQAQLSTDFILDTTWADNGKKILSGNCNAWSVKDIQLDSNGDLHLSYRGSSIIKISGADGSCIGATSFPSAWSNAEVAKFKIQNDHLFAVITKTDKTDYICRTWISNDCTPGANTKNFPDSTGVSYLYRGSWQRQQENIDYSFANETITFVKSFGAEDKEMIYAGIKYEGAAVYSRNLSTGATTICNDDAQKTFYDSIEWGRLGQIAINPQWSTSTVGSGSLYIYSKTEKKIFAKKLVKQGNDTYCPHSTDREIILQDGNALDVNNGTVGIVFDPNNPSNMYFLSRNNHSLYKTTLSSQSGSPTISRINKVGGYGRKRSSSTNTFFSSAESLAFDTYDGGFVVTASNGGKNMKSFSPAIAFKNETPQPSTRMTGALKAIKELASDSSLTTNVNFGWGVWSSGSADFTGWDNTTPPGKAIPNHNGGNLRVKVSDKGADEIIAIVENEGTCCATEPQDATNIAFKYFSHATESPINPDLDCQDTYLVIIGDGGFNVSDRDAALIDINAMWNNFGIKTFTVAYGGGLSGTSLQRLDDLAAAGQTTESIIATTPASLKSQLKAQITEIIGKKFAYNAPAIAPYDDGIENGNSLFQATFEVEKNEQWSGNLYRYELKNDGTIDKLSDKNWNMNQQIPSPDSRKIWSIIPGTDYTTDYNNFKEANSTIMANTGVFDLFGYEVADFHRDTVDADNPGVNRIRCNTNNLVNDGNLDDIKGLISFVRGKDWFDYDGDCDLSETLTKPMAEIFHSELLVVGPPEADNNPTNKNQESYWRNINNYKEFKEQKKNRKSTIYVGSNAGMLHAIDATTGAEMWGFVPPILASMLPTMTGSNYNKADKGGSSAIYGVDGSPVVHDMFFKSPLGGGKKWHTILMIPYGRGGNGFSVLDITDPDQPLHLYSFFNDESNSFIHHVDHLGTFNRYQYPTRGFTLKDTNEARIVDANPETDPQICYDKEVSGFNDQHGQECYKSKSWTLGTTLTAADVTVYKDNQIYTGATITPFSGGMQGTFITLNDKVQYSKGGHAESANNDNISIVVNKDSPLYVPIPGVMGGVYDYSTLGETWSSPRIFRMPNESINDNDLNDDIYVAVMGAGYSGGNPQNGSSVFVINLESSIDPTTGNVILPGKVEKVIDLQDKPGNNIVNAAPASPVVIQADGDILASSAYRGALVYQNDFEGKIHKINLTNLTSPNVKLFDSKIIFDAQADNTNKRLMYHSLEAGIGGTTNNFWLFGGTGDFHRFNDKSVGTDNILFGIKDPEFPYYTAVSDSYVPANLTQCTITTTETIPGENCPTSSEIGWVIHLPNFSKVSNEPTLNVGNVLFPVYQPTLSANLCNIGSAFICEADDECGTNITSTSIGLGSTKTDNVLGCRYVGQGILSKIVVSGGRIFANVAGAKEGEESLINIKAGRVNTEIIRRSWRENN